jgi:tetratricopeptide (TPR) repeat protein
MVFREGICTLVSYLLIKKAAIRGVYSLHPLMHCWSRDHMSHEEQKTKSALAATMLSSSITFHFTAKDLAFCRALIPHLKALNQYTTEVGFLLPYQDKQYTCFSLAYHEAGYWKEAEELQVAVMQMRKRILGEEHPDTLRSVGNLASTYQNQGRWKEAEELQVQVMQMSKRVLGEKHPDTLLSVGNLASIYQNQGRWKEAEELQVQMMQMSKRVLGEEHPDTLTSVRNLASTYWNQGQWKEAEELDVQVMQMSKRVLGEEHPNTLKSVANLASTSLQDTQTPLQLVVT